MAKKRTLGRRKIEMKLIESKSARQVTFSKRRFGLFKKASELCTLTNCEIVLVVFSPSGKAFSFGHRCVNTIVQRFLGQSPTVDDVDLDPHGSLCSTLHQQYTELCKQLEVEKTRSKELELEGMKCQKPSWFDASIDVLSVEQLEESIKCMRELKEKIAQRINELSLVGSALTLAPTNFVGDIDLNAIPEEI